MRYDFAQYNTLQRRPLRLPRTISGSARAIRVFMSYLKQEITQSTLIAAANRQHKNEGERVKEALRQLTVFVGIPSDHDGLCLLVAYAPALRLVCSWAGRISHPDILPQTALLSDQLVQEFVDAYHSWIVQRGQARPR